MQTQSEGLQQDFVMKHSAVGYIVMSTIFGAVMLLWLAVWLQAGRDTKQLSYAFIACVLWAGFILSMASHKVSVSNGICTVQKFYGIRTSFEIADITHIEFKLFDVGRGVGRRDLVIKYKIASGREDELRVNTKSYSKDANRRLTAILGYQGPMPWEMPYR